MKKSIYTIILIFALFLTACNNTPKNNITQNYTNDVPNGSNIPDGKASDSERISYSDYVKKYNLEPKDSDTPNGIEADEPSEDNQDFSQNNNEENLESDQNLLSFFATSLRSSTTERVENIKIVCNRLNNFTLNPNETFSYNQVAGPYGPEDGFKEATILLSDGTEELGYGGGVCQLSSTLYNVIKNIDNIEITERHNHSVPVSYVPEGEDATVSLQSGLDFKFVNTNNFPIRFVTKCEDWQVKVWAYKDV